MVTFEKIMKQSYLSHSLHLRDATEKFLWHHQLFPPCHQYLYNSHKYIDGVPNFSDTTSKVLDQCTTCIQPNISKTPPGHGTTCVATQPCQGLSVNFYLSGMTSDESDQKTIYEGINGESCWIFIRDNFTGMKHGYKRNSKASPIAWISNFLKQYSPNCNYKYIHLDKGGELFNNPDVKNLLK